MATVEYIVQNGTSIEEAKRKAVQDAKIKRSVEKGQAAKRGGAAIAKALISDEEVEAAQPEPLTPAQKRAATRAAKAAQANALAAPATKTPRKRAASNPPAEEAAGSVLTLERIATTRVLVPVIGTAPLIMHAWSQKAKQQMLDATQGKKRAKEPKNPQQDFRESLYFTRDGGYGMPSLGFKASIVSGARFFRNATMVQIKQALRISGVLSADTNGAILLTPITGEPTMREDCVRVGMGGTDLRYRGEFSEWTAVLDLTFVNTMLSLDSVLSLVDAGGNWVGVGEWRPEKSGANGTYSIDPNREPQIIGS